jgi:hypothetical protein
MVKSFRYDQENGDVFGDVAAGRLCCAGDANTDANFNGYSAPDRNPAPYGHTDACANLPATEPRSEVDTARSV